MRATDRGFRRYLRAQATRRRLELIEQGAVFYTVPEGEEGRMAKDFLPCSCHRCRAAHREDKYQREKAERHLQQWMASAWGLTVL